MQDYVEQGAVDTQRAVVLDESEFSETVHEKTNPGAGGANHLCQRLLADLGCYHLRLAVLAKSGKQQEGPCQPLFTGKVYNLRFVCVLGQLRR